MALPCVGKWWKSKHLEAVRTANGDERRGRQTWEHFPAKLPKTAANIPILPKRLAATPSGERGAGTGGRGGFRNYLGFFPVVSDPFGAIRHPQPEGSVADSKVYRRFEGLSSIRRSIAHIYLSRNRHPSLWLTRTVCHLLKNFRIFRKNFVDC